VSSRLVYGGRRIIAMSSHMEIPLSSNNILNLADSFIEQMAKITNFLKLMRISSLIMMTVALGVVMYLVYHPSFFSLLATNSDFGFILIILIVLIIEVFSVCIISAIRQYNFINSWNKRYQAFILRNDELNKMRQGWFWIIRLMILKFHWTDILLQ
jgi:hypothetical protein